MRRFSKQREAILKVLRSTYSHPSAAEVYKRVQSDIPNISLGTVYRNLAELTQSGEIQSFHTSNGCEHYDANTLPHSHFVCRGCGKISDIHLPQLDRLILQAGEELSHEVQSYGLQLFGICSDCKGRLAGVDPVTPDK